MRRRRAVETNPYAAPSTRRLNRKTKQDSGKAARRKKPRRSEAKWRELIASVSDDLF